MDWATWQRGWDCAILMRISCATAAVRHWLEASGERCLVVFDDAGDLDGLRPFVPAAGDAQIIVTSGRQAAADMGLSVPVGALTEATACRICQPG
jgi:hypothetical protein